MTTSPSSRRPSKPEKLDRRAAAAALKSQTAGSERRRNLLIIGLCLVVGMAIIGAAAWGPIQDRLAARKWDKLAISEIGAPASVCGEVTTKPAVGAQEHVDEGTALAVTDFPPAFGQHYPVWEGMERKLYTAKDRPPLGRLIHNLEHGFTILWYDETAAKDSEQMDLIRGLARKKAGTDDLRLKFKAAPWLESDGGPFPKGQHIAFTHWSVGGVGADATQQQVGAFQYCSEVSGAALEQFMLDYPYMDSPEPGSI